MLVLLALLMAPGAAESATAIADRRLSRMTSLYEQVCLNTFPDDKAIEALMTAQHARPLTAEEVKVTMGDDPARGWSLEEDGNPSVWIEFPPYHACTVRWNTPELADPKDYRAAIANYARTTGRFDTMNPFDKDDGDIHIHAVGQQRNLAGGGIESLFVVDQHITDPSAARREIRDMSSASYTKWRLRVRDRQTRGHSDKSHAGNRCRASLLTR